MTVDGLGFGTLTGESCLKNVHCHTDRASWDAILVTVVAFGARMWQKCAQSHSFGLGRVGGGDTIGGGGVVGQPRTGIIYAFPASPSPNGMVWNGVRGAGVCGKGGGAVGAAAGETAGRHRQGQHSTQTLRKP